MNAARVPPPAPVIAPIRSARGTHQSCPAASRHHGNPRREQDREYWRRDGWNEELGPRFWTILLMPCLTELVSAVFRPVP